MARVKITGYAEIEDDEVDTSHPSVPVTEDCYNQLSEDFPLDDLSIELA